MAFSGRFFENDKDTFSIALIPLILFSAISIFFSVIVQFVFDTIVKVLLF